MKKQALLTVAFAATLLVTGCKLIKTSDYNTMAGKSGEAADTDKISSLIKDTFDSKLVPLVSSKAVDLNALSSALKSGLDDAGGKLGGLRIGGAGGSWNFAVKGNAKVLEVDRQSKAGAIKIDTDGDGKADAVLQVGPVVKGTALRDFAPFYDFSQFRDQIEFAKLGRSLNEAALAKIPALGGDLTGKTITFSGVVALRSASDPILVMPVTVDVAP